MEKACTGTNIQLERTRSRGVRGNTRIDQFPTVILAGKNRESPPVQLESHLCSTAMFLTRKPLLATLEVHMVGFSEHIENRGWYQTSLIA